jgi:hypothetical protein
MTDSRLPEQRQRIAQAAARLVCELGIADYGQAKRKAARQLGIDGDKALPDNAQVQAAVREYQRLFAADRQPLQLERLRRAALEAMDFLARFQPRLVGPVLDGTADGHSVVTLHLFSDRPEDVALFLAGQGIGFDQGQARLRLQRQQVAAVPVLRIGAGGIDFDLLVLPVAGLRQAPVDPVGVKPMQRASRDQLARLLAGPEPARPA